MPDELWNEVHDIVQETGIKTIPMEKEMQKSKWLSGAALQIAVKRREAKSKGEKEKYKHLNEEFQRIARRDKKGFLSDKCKEIEGVPGRGWSAAGFFRSVLCSVLGPGGVLCSSFSRGSYPTVWFASPS